MSALSDGFLRWSWPMIPSLPCVVDRSFPGQVMDKLYFGLGAAFYLLFVIWCIATPQK
jgi:hypothetical protein